MSKILKYSAIIFIILLSATQASFAVTTYTASFTDSNVTPTALTSGAWTWTHILDNNEFTPNLAAGDTINVTDARLTIQMDIKLNQTIDPNDSPRLKVFQTDASGDSLLLGTYTIYDNKGDLNNQVWPVNLGTLALQALNDKNLAVTLSLIADHGSIKNVDSSLLSGNALVTDPPPSVPEPSTFLLLGAALMGIGLVRKGIKR